MNHVMQTLEHTSARHRIVLWCDIDRELLGDPRPLVLRGAFYD